MPVGSHTAAVHRSRLCFSTILQPDGWPRSAGWNEDCEVFEVVGYKPGHFHEFVIVGGGIALQVADSELLRLLLARGDRNKRDDKGQHCECESTFFSSQLFTYVKGAC